MGIGFELKIKRLKAGLYQYQVATRAGMTQNILCLIENGRRIPKSDEIKRIEQAINVAEGPCYDCREGEEIVDLPLPKIQGNRTKQ